MEKNPSGNHGWRRSAALSLLRRLSAFLGGTVLAFEPEPILYGHYYYYSLSERGEEMGAVLVSPENEKVDQRRNSFRARLCSGAVTPATREDGRAGDFERVTEVTEKTRVRGRPACRPMKAVV